MKNKIEDLQYNLDGTIDLKWFNSIPKDNQIMLGGKWTAKQFADYKSKKTNLDHNETLDLEIEEYIEDCIEIARIENEKFGTEEYFLGRNESGAFLVVSPYYDEFYNHMRHLYIEVDTTSVTENFTYESFYDEYEYKRIKEAEYQTIFKIFENANSQMYDLLMKDSKILDRKVREDDYIWHHGGVMKIKAISYEMGKYWSSDYHCEYGCFAIYRPLDSIPYNDGNVSIFEPDEEWPSRLITEEAFLNGYEIGKNALAELRWFIENLYIKTKKIDEL